MAMETMMGNIELLRALKRMGLKPDETQEVIIVLKPHEPVTVYIKRTPDADSGTDLVLTIVDGDFQVLWEATKDKSTEDTPDDDS